MNAASPVGVLALQGDFEKHLQLLRALGAQAAPVRAPEALSGLAGLVIPGGESTTIGMLMQRFGLLDAVRDAVGRGMALFGTCAGAILLAQEIENSVQPRLGLMDITVIRNAYGRQIESFEAVLTTPETSRQKTPQTGTAGAVQRNSDDESPFGGQAVTAVFIRAPVISRVGAGVTVLAEFESRPVLVRQGRLLAATFHPELTENGAIHRYFLNMALSANEGRGG